MYLYQIGDWRSALIASDKGPVELESSRSFKYPQSELSNSPGTYPHADPVRPLVEAGQYTATGTLVSGLNGAESSWEQRNYLLQLAGRPYQPIIALVPQRGLGHMLNRDNPGNAEKNTINDIWLVTYGAIMGVDRVSNINVDGDIPESDAGAVNLTLVTAPYWEPLDDVRWRFRTDGRIVSALMPDSTTYPVEKNRLPPRERLQNVIQPSSLGRGFEQLRFDPTIFSDSPMYEPYAWVQGYSRSADTFKEYHRAYLPTDDPTNAIAYLTGGSRQHTFYPDPNLWPAPPRSMYYFSNFNVSGGTLAITVTTRTPAGNYQETSVLELDDLDAALASAGYTGIQDDDRMIVGALERSGGIYLRDNGSGLWEPLPFFIPWQYSGIYPGETFQGRNTVLIEGSSTVRYSYAHIYRTF